MKTFQDKQDSVVNENKKLHEDIKFLNMPVKEIIYILRV